MIQLPEKIDLGEILKQYMDDRDRIKKDHDKMKAQLIIIKLNYPDMPPMDYDLTNVDIDAIGVSCNYDSFRLDSGRIITRKGLTTIEELPKKQNWEEKAAQWMESLLTKNIELQDQ